MEQFKPQSSVSMIKFTYMILSHGYCEDENQKINIYKCAYKLSSRFITLIFNKL